MGGGMMGGMGGGPGGFLQNPEFANLLELTPEQTTELQRIFTEAGTEMRMQMQAVMQAGGAPPNFEEMRRRGEQFVEGIQEMADQILRPEQRTKSREVMFQLSGGLNSPMLGIPTMQILNLTDAQKEQVRKALTERDEAFGTAMQGFDFRNATPEERESFREKFRTEMEARAGKLTEKITSLLTAEQRAKAEKLTAEAPALRERLGMPAPGERPRREQQRGSGERDPGVYVPGEGSWRPGQGAPDRAPQPQLQRRGGFPRGEE